MYPTYADHPITHIYDARLSMGVNSDTRTMTNVTVTQEYEKLHRTFGWGKAQFLECNLHALRAAFVPEPVKQQLTDRLLEGYQALQGGQANVGWGRLPLKPACG